MSLNETLSPPEPYLESRDAAAERLAQLPIVADAPSGVVCGDVQVCFEADEDSTLVSREYFEAVEPGTTVVGGERLDPTKGPDEQALFDAAAATLRAEEMQSVALSPTICNEDGRWWDAAKLDALRPSLRDLWRITATDANPEGASKSLDVLNFFGQLEPAEIQDIQESFDALARVTKGKIFDRIKGVALVNTQYLVDFHNAPPNESPWGLFHGKTGILFLNPESIRESEAKGKRHGFEAYTDQIGPISILKRTTVHEASHAMMDVRYEGDAAANNLGHVATATGLFPAQVTTLGDLADLGWRKVAGANGTKWALNDAVVAEVGELPPTDYAITAPVEDGADSLSLVALGADVSKIPMRVRLVHDAIEKAEGDTMQVESVTMTQQEPKDGEPLASGRLQAIRLSVYIGKGAMPQVERTSKSRLHRRRSSAAK